MRKEKYDEATVIRSLSKNPNINITRNFVGKGVIEIKRGATTVGNGSWGKIDFLCNYCGYIYLFVKGTVVDKTSTEHKKKSAKREVKSGKSAMSAFDKKVLKMRK